MKLHSPKILAFWALTSLAFGTVSTFGAEVYKIVDKNGRVTYTDSPPAGAAAEKLEIREANRLPPAAVRQQNGQTETREERLPDDYQLSITYPPAGYHVNPGERSVDVQVSAQPSVHSRHQLQITDNGEVVPGTSLDNIVVRGPHLIRARVVDENGRTISQSEPVQIFVHRPTVKRQPSR